MCKTTLCFLLVLLGSCTSSFGQSTPKLTSPQIVATFERLNQTKEIKPVTIYTPPRWGTFRISIVLVLTVANSQNFAYWNANLNFTDGAGTNAPCLVCGCYVETNVRETGVSENPIRAKAGLPIKFGVAPQGDTSGTKYNVWVVVEQLM